MKKGKIIAGAVLCGILFTGCGKNSGMPKLYKESLDYTFDEYTMSEKHDLGDGFYKWNITFTDKNGNEQSPEIYSRRFDKDLKKYFDSKKEMQETDLYDFYCAAVRDIACKEMWDDIASEYFDLDYERGIIFKNDDISMAVLVSLGSQTILPENAFAKDGIRLSEMDLSSLVSKDYVLTNVAVTVHENVDPEPYIEKLEAVIADFEEYAPRNYSFRLKSKDKDVLFVRNKLLGEEIDESELVDDEGKKISIRLALDKAIETK